MEVNPPSPGNVELPKRFAVQKRRKSEGRDSRPNRGNLERPRTKLEKGSSSGPRATVPLHIRASSELMNQLQASPVWRAQNLGRWFPGSFQKPSKRGTPVFPSYSGSKQTSPRSQFFIQAQQFWQVLLTAINLHWGWVSFCPPAMQVGGILFLHVLACPVMEKDHLVSGRKGNRGLPRNWNITVPIPSCG